MESSSGLDASHSQGPVSGEATHKAIHSKVFIRHTLREGEVVYCQCILTEIEVQDPCHPFSLSQDTISMKVDLKARGV
ncbi:unnamed protein product [Arctogadus glacialis]